MSPRPAACISEVEKSEEIPPSFTNNVSLLTGESLNSAGAVGIDRMIALEAYVVANYEMFLIAWSLCLLGYLVGTELRIPGLA